MGGSAAAAGSEDAVARAAAATTAWTVAVDVSDATSAGCGGVEAAVGAGCGMSVQLLPSRAAAFVGAVAACLREAETTA